jgi:hypothetical protein
MAADEMPVVVVVQESISAPLAGHAGCAYTSPPQPRAQALALVALLLGCPAAADSECDRWVQAIAGGRRIIALRPSGLAPMSDGGEP